ncbi:PAC2 family protein [Rarobacter faecitabidus]|uniref:PAC2 family protein n=1 Tax=Rarobacter faecitabidus TaxID=13243 RepID=A0A542ZWA7_RARFA|nr:PAC2 family protein [Rarobacter faecitabidus]
MIYTINDAAERELAELTAGAGVAMIVALEGYIDAGQAGKLLSDDLLRASRRLVTFDTDEFIDARSRRPMVTYDDGAYFDLKRHVLAMDVCQDAQGVPFLLLHGLEPDYRWDRFVTAVLALAERFGVDLTINVHGIPVAVPHSRPSKFTTTATRGDLVEDTDQWFDRVTLPAALATVLHVRLGEEGRDAVGIAVHVPHYLAQMPYFPAALGLADRIASLTRLELDTAVLEDEATKTIDEVASRVTASAELTQLVASLEGQYDAVEAGRSEASLLISDLDQSANNLADEVEQFLAQQRPEQK